MTTTPTTYITTPSDDQLEHAWWELMQGELGIDHDPQVRNDMQALYDIVRRNVDKGMPVMTADGEQLSAVSSERMAERMVRAYAELFYGGEGA